MKKIIFSFILGGIIFGSVVYAVSYKANDISYIKSDGSETNVEEALDNLYTDYNQYLQEKFSYNVIAKNYKSQGAASTASKLSTSITIPSEYDGKEGLVIAFSGQGTGLDEETVLTISSKTGVSSMEEVHKISAPKHGGIVAIYKVKYVGGGVITISGRNTTSRKSVSIVALN